MCHQLFESWTRRAGLKKLMNKTPLVSIVMPVFNAGDFLLESINSICNQTYTRWELVVVDDASTDESFSILKNLSKVDNRIKVFANKKRLGVSKTANLAISKTKGEFIARMDADDIALPQRIEKQVSYLLENPKIVALGSQCILIDGNGYRIGKKQFPLTFDGVKGLIFSSIPVQQPTLMVNKSLLPKNFTWYDSKANTAEEVELLFKLFQIGKVENLPEFLLEYRIHGSNTSLKDPKKTFFLTLKTRIQGVVKYGYKPTISGIFISLLQTIIVTLLPSSLIFPIYALLKGMRNSVKGQVSESQLVYQN